VAIGAASDPTLQRVVRGHPLTPDDRGVGDATPEPAPAAVFIAEDPNRARMAAGRSIGEVRRIRDDVNARVFELLMEMTPDPTSAVDRRRVRASGDGRTR